MATIRLEERSTQTQVCFIFQLGAAKVLTFTTQHSLMQRLGKAIKKFLPVSLHFGCCVSLHAYAEQKCQLRAEVPGSCLFPAAAPLSVWLM